jgi:hypothetical protein
MKALKILVATVALAIAATTAVVACGDGPCKEQCKNGQVCKEKCGNGENCKGELWKAQSKQKDAKAAKATKAVKDAKAPQVAKATK